MNNYFINIKTLIAAAALFLGTIASAQVPCLQKVEGTPIYSNDFGTGTATTTDANVLLHQYQPINPGDGFYTVTRSLTQTATYIQTDLNGNKDAGYTNVADGSTNGRYLAINVASAPSLNQAIYRVSNLGVAPGLEYRFRIDMAGLFNGTDVPSLRLNVRDALTNTVIATTTSQNNGVANDDIWRRIQLSFTPLSSLVNIEIVNLQGSGGSGNDVGIDNIVLTLLECDTDGDGIPNILDLDDDNDGIPDTAEGCSASVVTGAVNDAVALNLLRTTNTAVFPLIPVNAVLPLGGVRVTKNSGGNGWQFYTPPPVPTTTITANGVTSAPFPTTYLDIIAGGTTPGVARNLTIDFGISASQLSTPGNDYEYIIGIAGLGGPTNDQITTTFSVPLEVIGNADVYSTGTYSLLNGVPSTTPGQTGTVVSTSTPLTTTQGYTFYFIPRTTSSFTMNLVGGADQHGFIFGVYSANCVVDSNSNNLPDNYEVDADGDGCPDAIEGSERVSVSQIHRLTLPTTDPNYIYRGQIKVLGDGFTAGTPAQVVSTTPLAKGVPSLLNNAVNNTNGIAGAVDATDGSADVGQGIGNSRNNAVQDLDCTRCFRPATTAGTTLSTNHGITALGRAGSQNGNWPAKINGAYTALDAKTKGFVVNRLTTVQINALTPVIGMMAYDTTVNCLKIYDGTTWSCYTKQTCDDFNN